MPRHGIRGTAVDDDETMSADTRIATVPVEPTEAMLEAARDWSIRKYGKPIGNDAAQGCWAAMLPILYRPHVDEP